MTDIDKDIKALWEDVTSFDDPQIEKYTTLLTNIRNQLTTHLNKTLSQSNVWTVIDSSGLVAQLLDKASDWALARVTHVLNNYTKANRDQRGKQLEWIIVSIYEILYYSMSVITLTVCNKLAQVQNLKLDIIKIVPGRVVIQINNNQNIKSKLWLNLYTMLDQIDYNSIWQMLDSESIKPLLVIGTDPTTMPGLGYEDNTGSYIAVYFTTFTDLYKKLKNIIE